jgi:hypothetical protein
MNINRQKTNDHTKSTVSNTVKKKRKIILTDNYKYIYLHRKEEEKKETNICNCQKRKKKKRNKLFF